MTQQEIEDGADIAERAMMWVLFVRKPDMTNGQFRRCVVDMFGPEVDAVLAARFGGAVTVDGSR